jgi:hypothetical protein
MFTSDILYIFFIYYQVVYMLYFVLFLLRDRIFISKKNLRDPSQNQMRYIDGSRGGQAPLFVLGYRLVKTYFNRIFPVSSLSFFFLPCLVIFALNYVSVSFDISIIKKSYFWNKMDSPYGNVWIHLWDTCTFVHCRSVVCRQFVKTVQWSLVDCVKFSALVNKCVRPSCTCSLGGSTYPQQKNKQTNKAGDSPYNVSFLFYETWFCCLAVFIRYFRGLTLFSITNVVVLIWTRYMVVGPLKYTKAL